MDMKVIVATVILIGAVFVGGFIYRNGSGNISSSPVSFGSVAPEVASGIVYFYGAECPHCIDTLKFLEDNKIAEKVPFEKKEVWHNQSNAKELSARAKACGIAEDIVGVPFLYADGKCFVGTPDVEAYFSEKADPPVNEGAAK